MKVLLRYIATKHYAWLNGIIEWFRVTLYAPVDAEPKKILVIRKGTLGDQVVFLPVLHALRVRYPHAVVDMLTHDYGAGHIAANQVIREGLVRTYFFFGEFRLVKLWMLIRRERYDLVIECPQSMDSLLIQIRNMVFFRSCGIPSGAGWDIGSTYFLKRVQMKRTECMQETTRLFNSVRRGGILLHETGIYPVSVHRFRLPVSGPYAIIAIGAKQKRNRWPLIYFITIAKKLNEEGIETVWIGDHADARVLKPFQVKHNYCGVLTIQQSAWLLKNATVAISNDSGPMHLAYAVDTPVVAVFSGRDYPGKWYPPTGKQAAVIRQSDIACAICINEPCTDNVCMQLITPEMVWEKVSVYMHGIF